MSKMLENIFVLSRTPDCMVLLLFINFQLLMLTLLLYYITPYFPNLWTSHQSLKKFQTPVLFGGAESLIGGGATTSIERSSGAPEAENV